MAMSERPEKQGSWNLENMPDWAQSAIVSAGRTVTEAIPQKKIQRGNSCSMPLWSLGIFQKNLPLEVLREFLANRQKRLSWVYRRPFTNPAP